MTASMTKVLTRNALLITRVVSKALRDETDDAGRGPCADPPHPDTTSRKMSASGAIAGEPTN